jgi:hypothetical protein
MGESRRRQAERVVWASFSLSRESLNKNIFYFFFFFKRVNTDGAFSRLFVA